MTAQTFLYRYRLMTARLARKTGWAILLMTARAITPICPHVSTHYQADNDNRQQEQRPWGTTTTPT